MGLSLGGLTKSFINPLTFAQLAMGPAGWASLAVRTLGAAIAQDMIQQFGEKLGLPQSMISLCQAGFAAATGTQGGPMNIKDAVSVLTDLVGLTPQQQGELTRAAETDQQDMYTKLGEAMQAGKDMAEAYKSKGKNGGGSWLQKIADALAKSLDDKIDEMDKLATAMDKQGKNRSTKTSTDLQVAGQEFSFQMNTASTVIKTIGEGLSGMARKQ